MRRRGWREERELRGRGEGVRERERVMGEKELGFAEPGSFGFLLGPTY
jgi:hypothetical protein